ncbi:hypothetical protein PMAYCL1PPCAC_24755 [Pristionchus mayeri]|uniref:Uncharacterized protein n=1 Tax=Pristionchus mayeri TaxID=1317129 RepID=A0AAN5D1W3_9BILA|nr:hypothetical protein PMAYCL1PPCAC_24755 [Pristionchus mayeri]
MKKADNRPGIKRVQLSDYDGIYVSIHLYLSNIPFYDVSTLDWGKFSRSGGSLEPRLVVYLKRPKVPILVDDSDDLNVPEDPIFHQVFGLLSSYIKRAFLNFDEFDDFLLYWCLLNRATFGYLAINFN